MTPSLAISAWTIASWAASSWRALADDHRPRMRGTVKRKKIMPPKQIQNQSFQSPGLSLAAPSVQLRGAAEVAVALAGSLLMADQVGDGRGPPLDVWRPAAMPAPMALASAAGLVGLVFKRGQRGGLEGSEGGDLGRAGQLSYRPS